jgi:hypothetical protein
MMATVVEEKQKMDFQNVRVRISLRFDYVLFPFDIVELLENLAKIGYALTVPPPPRMVGQNVRLSAKGKIAQKGDIEIEVNDERGVIAASSSVPTLAFKSLNEIIQLIRDKLGVDLTEKASFYEIIGNLDVKTGRNAMEMVERISEKNKYMEELGSTLGQDVSSYTLRLVPRGQVPSQTEWLDITIEPNIVKPSTTYRVLVIYRSKDKPKIERFVQSLMESLAKVIKAIEA